MHHLLRTVTITTFGSLSTIRLTLARLVPTVTLTLQRKSSRLAGLIISVCLASGLLSGPFIGVAAAPGEELVEPGPLVVSTFRAVITQYSYADSCHNVVRGKCLMASGKPVYVGAVACPSSLPLGTRVMVNTTIYTCEDRYAIWLDGMRKLPTIDIFVPASPAGRSYAVVSVLQ